MEVAPNVLNGVGWFSPSTEVGWTANQATLGRFSRASRSKADLLAKGHFSRFPNDVASKCVHTVRGSFLTKVEVTYGKACQFDVASITAPSSHLDALECQASTINLTLVSLLGGGRSGFALSSTTWRSDWICDNPRSATPVNAPSSPTRGRKEV